MKNIKKGIAVALSVVMVAGALAACGSSNSGGGDAKESSKLKTGIGIVTKIDKSKAPAGAEEGLAEVDSLVAAVIVGEDGKIVDAKIDAIQTKLNFNAQGAVTSDLKAAIKSKQELKEDYGMKKASKVGKEWYEQANAFAEFAKGKTVEELKGTKVNEEGVATDKDLSASVTVHIGDFIAAVEKAVNYAQDLGAKEGDKLGLSVSTTSDKSKNATAAEAGQVQAYTFYSAVTTDKDGKITSCVIDASQGTVTFDATGKITNDVKAEVKSKNELKEEYGMKKASKIGKEWYEQAAAFAKFVTGKTGDEVAKIAMTDDGLASDKDLVASVTVHISPLMEIVKKAVDNAK